MGYQQRERKMRPIVTNWLQNQGYDCIYEILIGGYCDIVAFKFAPRIGRPIPNLLSVVAIELKMSDVKGVFEQAAGNQHHVNISYAAMPSERIAKMRPATRIRFVQLGIGLLAVEEERVELSIRPLPIFDKREQHLKQKLWRYKRKLIKKVK